MIQMRVNDRFENPRMEIRVRDYLTHIQELNGEDTIEFSYAWGDVGEVVKGDRLLWQDAYGNWHEHIAVRTEYDMLGMLHVYAENSACEMLCDYIEETHLVNAVATAAVAAALANSRFEADEVDALGTNSCVLYHMNALEALHKVADIWGGELEFGVDVDDAGVEARWVRLIERRGAWRGAVMDFSRNVIDATYTEREDEVVSALYGYGAGLPVIDEGGAWSGGYRRKLTFGDINDGKDYVADESARSLWGRWNAEHTEKVHTFGQVTFPFVTDKEKLLALTREALDVATCPVEGIEAGVIYDLMGAALALGDEVSIADRTGVHHIDGRHFRILRMRMDYGAGVRCKLSLGTVGARSWTASSDASAAIAAVEDMAGYASDQSTSNTEVAAAQELNIEELQNAVAVRPTATQMNAAIADAIAALDDLGGIEF